MDVFDLFAKISLDTSEYESGIENASGKFQDLGKKLSDIGGTMTKAVTLPIVGLGTAIIKTGADYEAGMDKVQAISGSTGEEMERLGDKAMEMAAKTKFSTADSAQAYQYMAMAGWDAGQMVDGLTGIMNLAAASGENLGTTSDIVTDALTAFGLTAADSGRFADVLAAASNSANTNVSMLGESFKYVAPVAGALGYSVEDTSVALGLMANSGIKASQSGTSLRTAITNMASQTKNMAAVMDEYGITLTDANGNMLSLSDVMTQLREKMGGLDEATQASAASALFGKEAMSGMLAIINAAPEDFNNLTEAINNSNGTTEEMARIMNDNASGAFERLKSAVNVLFTQLGELLIPAFTAVVEKVTEVVTWFSSLDEGTQKLILTIAGIAAVMGPVLSTIGNVITAVTSIGSAIGGLISAAQGAGTAISGLFGILAANPIAAVIAAVAALAAGIITLWNTNEDFRNAVKSIWEDITGFFKSAWDKIKATWDGAAKFFSGVWNGIKGVFSEVGEVLGGFFSDAWDGIQSAWGGAKEFFGDLWSNIKEKGSDAAKNIKEKLEDAWKGVKAAWSVAKVFFGDIWSNIKDKAAKAAEKAQSSFEKAWDKIKSAWNGAGNFFGGVRDDIVNAFSNIKSKFLEIGGNIVSGLKKGILDGWDKFTSWLSSKVGGLVNAVKNMLGIHSPSRVFADIGKNMALGLEKGWGDEYGGVKREIEDGMQFSNALRGLFAGSGEELAALGQEIAGMIVSGFSNAGEVVAERVVGFIAVLAEGFTAQGESLLAIGLDMLQSVGRGFTESPDETQRITTETVANLVTGFTENIPQLAEAGALLTKGLIDGMIQAIADIPAAVEQVVTAIVDGFKDLFGIEPPSRVFMEMGSALIEGLLEGISETWVSITDFFTEETENLIELLNETWDTIKNFAVVAWGGIRDVISDAWQMIKSDWSAAKPFFEELWSAIADDGKKAADKVKDAFKKAWETVKTAWGGATDFFRSIHGKIISVFSDMGEKFQEIGSSIVNGLKDGVSNNWEDFVSWLVSKVSSAADTIKEQLDTSSKPEVLADVGGNVAASLGKDLTSGYDSIKSQIKNGLNFETAAVDTGSNGYVVGRAENMLRAPARGGDIFNFYSPKALDPVSAAREMKKAKQQMTLSYV